VTPQAGSGLAVATRPPLVILVLLYLLPFVIAASAVPGDFRGGPQGDVGLYLEKAHALLSGLAPYRDFLLEYPPLSLIPMVVPVVLWPFGPVALDVYPWLFAGEMAVLLVVLALVVGRIVGRRAADAGSTAVALAREQRDAGLRLVILSIGAALALTWRFDLFPALLAVVAVWAALERHASTAGFAIGIGVLAKLFPLAVGPAVAVAWLAPLDRGGLARYAGTIAGVIVVGMLPFVALAGTDALAWLGYQTARGLQIESVGGGLVLLSGVLTGQPIALDAPFSAWEVTGRFARDLLVLTSAALVVGFAGLAALGWRRMRTDEARRGDASAHSIVALATASMLLLVLTSKVFSIQYVVWVLPFAALLPWRKFWLAAAAFALTMPIHPLLYERLVAQEPLPVVVLNTRNALLVALLAWLVWDLARSHPREMGVERKAETRTAARGLERP
jgi:hypothetical protein